jgi:hypothetical protein
MESVSIHKIGVQKYKLLLIYTSLYKDFLKFISLVESGFYVLYNKYSFK